MAKSYHENVLTNDLSEGYQHPKMRFRETKSQGTQREAMIEQFIEYNEYDVSLRKPDKRYAIKKEDRVERI